MISGYKNLFTILGVLILASQLVACEGAESSEQAGLGSPVFGGNTRPDAVIGPPIYAPLGVATNLDGTGSSDFNNDPLTYIWDLTVPAGSAAGLMGGSTSTPSLNPDRSGYYYATLTVNDGTIDSFIDDTGLITTTWMLNDVAETSVLLTNTNGSPVEVNMQSLDLSPPLSSTHFVVTATGIPNYVHKVTAGDIAWLDGLVAAYSGDFVTGTYTTALNNIVDFGTDIGYATNGANCVNTGGLGWWPPGPFCPEDQATVASFAITPTVSAATCYTGLGATGLLNNGVSIFNWSDGLSHNANEGIWHNLAGKFEAYDLDLCMGHSETSGEYHQHVGVPCLEEQLGDDGTGGHSPIYGYAADGYPVYGPWEDIATPAQSCWATRDYADQTVGTTGCDTTAHPDDAGTVPPTVRVANDRVCTLNDPLDWTLGTTLAAKFGPLTTATEVSQSGHDIPAVSGVYFEDYWYDDACTGGEFLDEHNGHDTGDLRGYHYHLTDTFPYNIGPTFYGELDGSAMMTCNNTPF